MKEKEINTGIGSYHIKKQIEFLKKNIFDLSNNFDQYVAQSEIKISKEKIKQENIIDNTQELIGLIKEVGFPEKVRDMNKAGNVYKYFFTFTDYLDDHASHIEFYEGKILQAGIKKPPRHQLIRIIKGLDKDE